MPDSPAKNSADDVPRPGRGWRIAGWVLFGGVLGAAMAALFFAYGQPGMLLEQLNLRYCG